MRRNRTGRWCRKSRPPRRRARRAPRPTSYYRYRDSYAGPRRGGGGRSGGGRSRIGRGSVRVRRRGESLFLDKGIHLDGDVEDLPGLLRRGDHALNDEEARRLVDQVDELGEGGVGSLASGVDGHHGEGVGAFDEFRGPGGGLVGDAGVLGNLHQFALDGGGHDAPVREVLRQELIALAARGFDFIHQFSIPGDLLLQLRELLLEEVAVAAQVVRAAAEGLEGDDGGHQVGEQENTQKRAHGEAGI